MSTRVDLLGVQKCCLSNRFVLPLVHLSFSSSFIHVYDTNSVSIRVGTVHTRGRPVKVVPTSRFLRIPPYLPYCLSSTIESPEVKSSDMSVMKSVVLKRGHSKVPFVNPEVPFLVFLHFSVIRPRNTR